MNGKLIVLDGTDGCGKSTQFKLLTQRLEREGVDFRKIAFPRYDNSSSAVLRAYLGGDFGTHPHDVNAYAASTLFFVDRFASYKTDWGSFYENGGLVICDRYTTSNAIHQGAKMPPEELNAFLRWLYDFEFRLMELPKPDAVLYMDIDLKTSIKQLEARQERTHTKGDIHETHVTYLENCLRAGKAAASRLGWKKIACLKDGKMRDEESIHEDIYKIVKGLL